MSALPLIAVACVALALRLPRSLPGRAAILVAVFGDVLVELGGGAIAVVLLYSGAIAAFGFCVREGVQNQHRRI